MWGGGALREDSENGCVADYARWEWNLSAYLQLVPATEVMVGDGLPLLWSNFKSPNHFKKKSKKLSKENLIVNIGTLGSLQAFYL